MPYRPRDKEKRELYEALVECYGEPRYAIRSGFKFTGTILAVGNSVYGARYQCLWCGRVQLGTGRNNNHFSNCPTQAVERSGDAAPGS